MIGVLADPSETSSVREFFELFKTPWEFFRAGRDYDAIICSGDQPVETTARLTVVYTSPTDLAGESKTAPRTSANPILLVSRDSDRIPIYGECVPISGKGCSFLAFRGTSECAGLESVVGHRTEARLGYSLFQEIRHLLGPGQPASCALYPTVDLHISILRDLLLRSSIPFAEIPAVPQGYRFIACLTHDVDHPAIRNHFFDHTMLGFLYRATVGSVLDFLRQRKSFSQLARNWATVLSLPFVYIRLIKDPWDQFSRYLQIESGFKSTYFFIPKGRDAGIPVGSPEPRRAVKYSVHGVASQVRKLKKEDREIGLHGLDAWHEKGKARWEREQIAQVIGDCEVGVRMHWLYHDEKSPRVLEESGFSYDSSSGYNETVGYRAGILQVFKPLQAGKLLELPLNIMDTALFFPCFLDLSPKRAKAIVSSFLQHAVRFGGVLTINWHDRSLAPERCWDEFYIDLISELKRRGAWITSAGDAVAWFRSRRAAAIQETSEADGEPSIQRGPVPHNGDLPGLRLVVHNQAQDSVELPAQVCAV